MSSPGLRERKKAKTRRTIQEHALRLFAEQGYEATTVDQIAEAAEISPSTFFRYFATKEDVVIEDDYDPLLIRAFIAQPASLSPVAAFRRRYAKPSPTSTSPTTNRSFSARSSSCKIPRCGPGS
jgi:AcrR family transcriptional regulator